MDRESCVIFDGLNMFIEELSPTAFATLRKTGTGDGKKRESAPNYDRISRRGLNLLGTTSAKKQQIVSGKGVGQHGRRD